MKDQVTQNVEIERWRTWDEFSDGEKAAALVSLGKQLIRLHPGWTQEAAAVAILQGVAVQVRTQEQLDSPIRWSELSREQLAGRLVEVADWCGAPEGQPHHLRDACLDVAEDLRRTRSRVGRER